ncbi:hypothetical protein [Nocardioides sp.]|uniref:hypothetical protein n=1 Tax=Nocardioides sp. TaxID=35761 RepID=UPI0035164A83
MNREQLAQVLRAASRIAGDRPIVMGSQAILGTFDHEVLPDSATVSMEADLAFLDDPDRAKADQVTGMIGEDSEFHLERGYYAEGIHVTTARLAPGWEDRLVVQVVPPGADGPGAVACFLERHDLAAAKLAAFRAKDIRFVTTLADAQLIDLATVRERIEQTDLSPVARHRALTLLDSLPTASDTRADHDT